MNTERPELPKSVLLGQIAEFVGQSPGLKWDVVAHPESEAIQIRQSIDGKQLILASSALEDVLPRVDADGHEFLQVNFASGTKILLTGALIGFKPAQVSGAGQGRLPKVVTTPDIVSVFEAMQEAVHASESPLDDDVETLRKLFEAVVSGGEKAGFDLKRERGWLIRLLPRGFRATA